MYGFDTFRAKKVKQALSNTISNILQAPFLEKHTTKYHEFLILRNITQTVFGIHPISNKTQVAKIYLLTYMKM